MNYIHLHSRKLMGFTLLLLFIFCTRKADCITIAEKREINGNYYFFWEDDSLMNFNNTNDENSFASVPDRYASGQVSAQAYREHSVGDSYCDAD